MTACTGRGTSDMKGALAGMMVAATSIDKSELHGTVAVSASVMEEVMEGIALKAIMEIVQPDYVVIGESTNLNLNHGGRGRAEIHLEAIGQPAHSSTPHLGRQRRLQDAARHRRHQSNAPHHRPPCWVRALWP